MNKEKKKWKYKYADGNWNWFLREAEVNFAGLKKTAIEEHHAVISSL